MGYSKITGIHDLRWSATKAVLSILRAVNEVSQKTEREEGTCDNEGCGGNLHSSCPNVYTMRRVRCRFNGSSVHSQQCTTYLVNGSRRRESVNLFAVQQPFMSGALELEDGFIEGIGASSEGERKVSCSEEFKVILQGCVIELIARLTDMYMELGAVVTRDSNLQLITVCQIAQELMHLFPHRTGNFSFGLFQWLRERQPNSCLGGDPTNTQGVVYSIWIIRSPLCYHYNAIPVACMQYYRHFHQQSTNDASLVYRDAIISLW